MIKFLWIVLIVLFFSTSRQTFAQNCEEFLSNDPNSNIKSYLSELIGNQIIETKDFIIFIEGLKKGELEFPIFESKAGINSILSIHLKNLRQLFEDESIDSNQLVKWGEQKIREWAHSQKERNEVSLETKNIYMKMKFYPVHPHDFQMGPEGKKEKVSLKNSFEVLSTPVTQAQWVEQMGKNPSHHVHGEDTAELNFSGKDFVLQPDNPVENITWWSAASFANKMSEKAGLKPVYDLSQVVFNPNTSAEAGNLMLAVGTVRALKSLLKIKINAPNEDIYQTEGYRLPTEAEQEFLLILAKNEAMEEHAWFSDNSGDTTHPVAEKKPVLIHGNEIYDLYGNVSEWSNDYYLDKIKGGINPQGKPHAFVKDVLLKGSLLNFLEYATMKLDVTRVLRGSGYYSYSKDMVSHYRSCLSPSQYLKGVGLRLVRSIK